MRFRNVPSTVASLTYAILFAQWAHAAEPPATFTAPVEAGGTTYTVDFVRFDHRGPNFDLQLHTGTGLTSLEPDPTHHATYLGTIDEVPGALAGATYFSATGEHYYHVVFEDGEEWINEGGTTAVLSGSLGTNWAHLVPAESAGSSMWAAEVGVDLPNDRYTIRHGADPDDALAMIEHSIMATNLIYMRELGIQHVLGRVVLRGDAAVDPYAPLGSHNEYLTELAHQWNDVLPPSTHDVALVIRAEAGAGLASVGVVGNPGYSSNDASARGDFSRVWRHEVGHNWFLVHYDGGAPEGPTINSGNSIARTSGPEQALVLFHRDDRAGFLDELGPVVAVPVPPRAASDRALVSNQVPSVVIDVLANDHDANGDALTLVSIDPTSDLVLGGTMAIEPGGGAGGRDAVRYTPPALGSPTSAIDRFSYRIRDAGGLEAVGYVFVRVVDYTPDGTYAQNFDAYADGTTDLDDGSYISNVSEGSNARVLDHALELTPDIVWRQASFTMPPHSLQTGYTAIFRYRISASGSPADGFAFNYGAPNATRIPVDGIGDFPRGITVEWNTWANRGHQVRVNGTQVPGGYVFDSGLADGIWHNVTVQWFPHSGLTLSMDGETIFDQLPTPGFLATPDDMLAFSAYTGGLSQQVLIDNIMVARGILVSTDIAAATPARFVLGASVPNPFNPQTTLRFELPRAAPVELAIYDVRGHRVRTLFGGDVVPRRSPRCRVARRGRRRTGCRERAVLLPAPGGRLPGDAAGDVATLTGAGQLLARNSSADRATNDHGSFVEQQR